MPGLAGAGSGGQRPLPSHGQVVILRSRSQWLAPLRALHDHGVLDVLNRGVRGGGGLVGETLHVLDPDDHARELTSFTFPRQRRDRRLCLADFFRDREEFDAFGPDVLAMQLVTMGGAVARETQRLFEANSYRDYLELHGLSVQLTEGLAEMWHARTREELGYAATHSDVDAAIRDQDYRGSRYSFGYPACPDLEDRAKLVALLEPERIGVSLSEELQLHPEQSTDAIVVHHPEAKYFNAK